MKKQLETKREMIKKMPTFRAQDSHKMARISDRWRKPRGSDSKMRHQFKGYAKVVKQGYMTPAELKHISPLTGLRAIVVSTKEQIDLIDVKVEGILFSKTLGVRKKVDLIKHALNKKITILNIKDPAKFLEDFEAKQKKKKSDKDKKVAEKKKKEETRKKESEKAAAEKKDLDSKMTEEDKKEIEKKEKDKVLISTE